MDIKFSFAAYSQLNNMYVYATRIDLIERNAGSVLSKITWVKMSMGLNVIIMLIILLLVALLLIELGLHLAETTIYHHVQDTEASPIVSFHTA